MPNPLLPFDPTKPGDTDYRNVFPALDRSDKASLAAVLGTLAPSGTVTTAWRVQQVGNGVWLTQNASYHTGQWVLDDVTLSASAIVYNLAANQINLLWSPAGTSPFSNFQILGQFTANPNAVNNLSFWDSVSGSPLVIQAVGSDPNIGLNLVTKGTGPLTLNGSPLAQASIAIPGYLRLGPITLQWGTNSGGPISSPQSITVTFAVAFSSTPLCTLGLPVYVGAAASRLHYSISTATTATFVVEPVATTTFQFIWFSLGPS